MRIWPRKRTVKRWGIGASIVVGLLLVANAFMSWRVESRFKAKIAAIRAEGDPASIAELKPEPISAEENAAAHIDRIKPRLNEFSKEYGAFDKTPLGKEYWNRDEGESPTAEQLAAIREILDRYVDLEQMITKAAACDQYASTADFSLGFHDFIGRQISHGMYLRTIGRMADWRVQVLLYDNQRDQAIERWLVVLRLAKLHESEPTLVSYLVTVAVRGVAVHGIHRVLMRGPVTAETQERIDRELARQDDPLKFEKALRTERAVSVSASLEQAWEVRPAPWVWLVGWPVKRLFIAPFDYYEAVLAVVDRPWPMIREKFEKGGDLSTPTGDSVITDLVGSAIELGIRAGHRDRAMIRSLRVFNALQQFAVKNGREASGLAELELPKEATIDPFSGEPLIAKYTEDGWLVYSVAENSVDDGGSFDDVKDWGLGPRKKQVE